MSDLGDQYFTEHGPDSLDVFHDSSLEVSLLNPLSMSDLTRYGRLLLQNMERTTRTTAHSSTLPGNVFGHSHPKIMTMWYSYCYHLSLPA